MHRESAPAVSVLKKTEATRKSTPSVFSMAVSDLCGSRLRRRHIHPPVRRVALQLALENGQPAQTIGELRIFGSRRRVENRRVKSTEHLLERVVVSFAMAARQIGIRPRRRLH